MTKERYKGEIIITEQSAAVPAYSLLSVLPLLIHICLKPSSNLDTMFSLSSSLILANMRGSIFNPMKD